MYRLIVFKKWFVELLENLVRVGATSASWTKGRKKRRQRETGSESCPSRETDLSVRGWTGGLEEPRSRSDRGKGRDKVVSLLFGKSCGILSQRRKQVKGSVDGVLLILDRT